MPDNFKRLDRLSTVMKQETPLWSSKSTSIFQFSLKASGKTRWLLYYFQKNEQNLALNSRLNVCRIWVTTMFAELWQKPVYAPCKPAQDLSNLVFGILTCFHLTNIFGEEKFIWLPPKKTKWPGKKLTIVIWRKDFGSIWIGLQIWRNAQHDRQLLRTSSKLNHW